MRMISIGKKNSIDIGITPRLYMVILSMGGVVTFKLGHDARARAAV